MHRKQSFGYCFSVTNYGFENMSLRSMIAFLRMPQDGQWSPVRCIWDVSVMYLWCICDVSRSDSSYLAMLCYAMLCYAMLCYAMLCYAMLCYAMLCYAMLCCAMLCYAMLCYDMLCYDMLCYAMLWYTLHCYAMLVCFVKLRYATL